MQTLNSLALEPGGKQRGRLSGSATAPATRLVPFPPHGCVGFCPHASHLTGVGGEIVGRVVAAALGVTAGSRCV